MCPVYEQVIPSNLFSLQRAVENTDAVKEIEQRVHLLSGILASPVREDDRAEKARRIELRMFVFV